MINSVSHALRVLSLFKVKPVLGLSEIAKRLDLPNATVNRVLKTLHTHGFLVRVDRKYRVSLLLVDIAESATGITSLQSAAMPSLEKLSAHTGFSSQFAVQDGDEAYYVGNVDGINFKNSFVKIGLRAPLHASAAGKSILAFLPETQQADYFSRRHEQVKAITQETNEMFRAELKDIQTIGYAIHDSELISELYCVAVHVPLSAGRHGALSISASVSQRDKLPTPEIVSILQNEALKLQDTLS